MDILKLLQESKEELYPDDLDFFEQELVIGDYDDTYKAECKNEIWLLRAELCKLAAPPKEKAPAPVKKAQKPESSGGVVVSLRDIVPQEAESTVLSMSPLQQVQNDLDILREQNDYKKAFNCYIKDSLLIDNGFLDAHFSLFKPWELGAILSLKPLDEAFLEKYFGALDHDKIARYQIFSEHFFMKHFAQLNPDIVLAHGKNSWRVKERRSRQLDVFLRLKGIKL